MSVSVQGRWPTAKLICSSVWFQIADCELLLWSERVAQCLSDYASPECSKPNHRRLQWKVSRRTAQNLHSHRSVPELPTIPEACWDESERSVHNTPETRYKLCQALKRTQAKYKCQNSPHTERRNMPSLSLQLIGTRANQL